MDKIDFDKYKELSDRLKLGNRVCSGGLCCFLTSEFAREHDLDRTSFISYLSLRKNGEVYEVKRLACTNLDVVLEKDTVTFGCKLFGSRYRHPYCGVYPERGVVVVNEGRFREREFIPRQTCTAEWIKRDRDKGVDAYPFYLFDAEEFPEFEEFALGYDNGHLLVPVPKIPNCILFRQ